MSVASVYGYAPCRPNQRLLHYEQFLAQIVRLSTVTVVAMCGIAGSWSRTGDFECGVRLQRSLEAIRHRGPDDVGTFAWIDPASQGRVDLGLVRLAVLDLSAAGHQPMSTPDGRFTISFNGEITNYIEIREHLIQEGEVFSSGGDTEVLLKAWARWGLSCLDRLEGMYAFAVLDTTKRTLTLVRDPYGIKPLFYVHDRDTLTFNSEIRGLLHVSVTRPRLDWQVAVDYLQWGAYDRSDRTFVEGVRQLSPGHHLVFDLGTGRSTGPTRYWSPQIQANFQGSYESATERVRSLFLDSVRRNLRSDVPLGIALSGGIDSSAILGAARHLEPDLPIETFSFIAPGFAQSEHEWIELVATSLNATSNTVTAEPSELVRDLDDLILTQGEPFGSTSIYAQYRVFQLARERGIVVTLDGQGGDEMFAGYDGYPAQRMRSLIETGHWIGAANFVRHWSTWPGRDKRSMLIEAAGQFSPAPLRGRIIRRPASPLLDVRLLGERDVDLRFPLRSAKAPLGRRVSAELRSALTRVGLPSLLRHGDRNSMRFSIESRVPFLDRALNEFVFQLPESWLVGPDGTSKRILRDSLRDLVPLEVLERRDKVGFATPQTSWLERLAEQPLDQEHRVGFLRATGSDTLAHGLSEAELQWGPGAQWRLINLQRWVSLMDIDAS